MSIDPLVVLALFAYLLLVTALSLTKRNYLQSRTLHLFRALFPSWRFFEDLVALPLLEYRVAKTGTELGPWQMALDKPGRKLSSLFVNAEGTLYLACNGVLQQLESDIGELSAPAPETFEDSVSFQLVKNLVRFELSKHNVLLSGSKFQFKISRREPGAPDNHSEMFVMSKIYEV